MQHGVRVCLVPSVRVPASAGTHSPQKLSLIHAAYITHEYILYAQRHPPSNAQTVPAIKDSDGMKILLLHIYVI